MKCSSSSSSSSVIATKTDIPDRFMNFDVCFRDSAPPYSFSPSLSVNIQATMKKKTEIPSLRRRMWSAYQKDDETEGEEER